MGCAGCVSEAAGAAVVIPTRTGELGRVRGRCKMFVEQARLFVVDFCFYPWLVYHVCPAPDARQKNPHHLTKPVVCTYTDRIP